MGTRERPSGDAGRPSAKPLVLVVVLLLAATGGALLTTRADPPAGPTHPSAPIVVTHLARDSGVRPPVAEGSLRTSRL
jgi:hypothetical protein